MGRLQWNTWFTGEAEGTTRSAWASTVQLARETPGSWQATAQAGGSIWALATIPVPATRLMALASGSSWGLGWATGAQSVAVTVQAVSGTYAVSFGVTANDGITATLIGAILTAVPANAPAWLKVWGVGPTCFAKLWAASAPEPASWTAQWSGMPALTNPLPQIGVAPGGVWWQVGAFQEAQDTWWWDDASVQGGYVLAGGWQWNAPAGAPLPSGTWTSSPVAVTDEIQRWRTASATWSGPPLTQAMVQVSTSKDGVHWSGWGAPTPLPPGGWVRIQLTLTSADGGSPVVTTAWADYDHLARYNFGGFRFRANPSSAQRTVNHMSNSAQLASGLLDSNPVNPWEQLALTTTVAYHATHLEPSRTLPLVGHTPPQLGVFAPRVVQWDPVGGTWAVTLDTDTATQSAVVSGSAMGVRPNAGTCYCWTPNLQGGAGTLVETTPDQVVQSTTAMGSGTFAASFSMTYGGGWLYFLSPNGVLWQSSVDGSQVSVLWTVTSGTNTYFVTQINQAAQWSGGTAQNVTTSGNSLVAGPAGGTWQSPTLALGGVIGALMSPQAQGTGSVLVQWRGSYDGQHWLPWTQDTLGFGYPYYQILLTLGPNATVTALTLAGWAAYRYTGLAYDGQYLWWADNQQRQLVVFDPVAQRVVTMVPFPVQWPYVASLAWEFAGSHPALWVSSPLGVQRFRVNLGDLDKYTLESLLQLGPQTLLDDRQMPYLYEVTNWQAQPTMLPDNARAWTITVTGTVIPWNAQTVAQYVGAPAALLRNAYLDPMGTASNYVLDNGLPFALVINTPLQLQPDGQTATFAIPGDSAALVGTECVWRNGVLQQPNVDYTYVGAQQLPNSLIQGFTAIQWTTPIALTDTLLITYAYTAVQAS